MGEIQRVSEQPTSEHWQIEGYIRYVYHALISNGAIHY